MKLTIILLLIGVQFCGFGLAYKHQINVISEDEQGKEITVCIGNIIGEHQVLLVNVQDFEHMFIGFRNTNHDLVRNIEGLTQKITDRDNGFEIETAIADVMFPADRIVKLWNEKWKGDIPKQGTAATYDRELGTAIEQTKSYHEYTTSEDGKVLLVRDVKKYIKGMPLMIEDELSGVAFHHNQETRITKFAKTTNRIVKIF